MNTEGLIVIVRTVKARPFAVITPPMVRWLDIG